MFEFIFLMNLLFTPIYAKCDNWNVFKVMFILCQLFGLFLQLLVYVNELSDEYTESCLKQGYVYRLLF